jgi:hypothetical protein
VPTLSAVVHGLVASREWDAAPSLPVAFRTSVFGTYELTEITPDQVDTAAVDLAGRGKRKPSRNGTVPAGRPIKGSSVNR